MARVTADCSHFEEAVGLLSEEAFQALIATPQCHHCLHADPKGQGGLWVCLHDNCDYLGCSEGADHSSSHQKRQPAHCAQMNIASRRIWCYKCQREVLIYSATEHFGALILPKDGNSCQPRLSVFPERRRRTRGLVGLSNLGNTCYMNSALQCLLNSPALAEFFQTCPTLVQKAAKATPLSASFLKLVTETRELRNHASYVPPSHVFHAMKQVFPMFRGFQQHDAQEFLRCFMDLMHEELMEPIHYALEDEDNLESVSEAGSRASPAPESEPEEYETADSGVSEQSTASSDANSRKRKRPVSADTGIESVGSDRKKYEEGASPNPSTSLSDGELEFAGASSTQSGSPASSSRLLCPRSPLRAQPVHVTIRTRKPKVYRSVITDIFDGKLVSSVQCLTCNKVSTTTETFQDLSLPIPTQETLASLTNQPLNDGWANWAWNWMFGWFYGPNITLNDCLSYFFSADELKGDNMYSCEKCKKLRNGLKFSQVTVLPDTLCIHLKRFRHDFSFSSKISSKVSFPLVDLDMTTWLHKDATSQVALYDLTGVICHHGHAGGGHYTAFALNADNLEWYEFDDSRVTKVDQSTVMNAEAYVLFYRKNNSANEPIREEIQGILREKHSSLMKFFISKQWFNKFENFAEPGPIDNSDFLCRHGGVLPLKTDCVYDLCIEIPQPIWDRLHARYGGGPVCNRLQECGQCRMELDALTKQKEFELEEFKTLRAEFQETGTDVYYILSSSWFRIWEGFVTNRERDPPGPIENKAILTSSSRNGSQSLREGAGYLRISHEMWLLLHSIYGGGPEIVLYPNGSVQVLSAFKKPSVPALCTRLRARSTSESNWGAHVGVTYALDPRMTRSKTGSGSQGPHQPCPEMDEEEPD